MARQPDSPRIVKHPRLATLLTCLLRYVMLALGAEYAGKIDRPQ